VANEVGIRADELREMMQAVSIVKDITLPNSGKPTVLGQQ